VHANNKKPKIQKMNGGKKGLKKAASAFIILTFTIMVLTSIFFNMKTVGASNGSDYNIEHVNHTIKIMYNGYIFINDTIQITGQAPNGFLIGFPYKYGPYILQCVAYNSSDIFSVSLDVPFDNAMGFYGIRIDFPHGSTPSAFTVGVVLSNNLLTQTLNTSRYILDFPAYPSFTKSAAVNASIQIEGATRVNGTVPSFTYGNESLPAFTSSPANITFTLTSTTIQLFDINELKSEFRISENGAIECLDSYYITSKTTAKISSIEIILPPNALNPKAQDQFGRSMGASAWVDKKTGHYKVSFNMALESYRSTRFYVKYFLPSDYAIQTEANNFVFEFPLFKGLNNYIEQASLTFVLPEGAKITSFKITLIDSAYSITRNVFQETIAIKREGISYLDNLLPSTNVLQFAYQYNPLWASFRPTLWVWALTILGCAVILVWKRPKVAPAPIAMPKVVVTLRPENIKSFVNLYEEKRKIIQESESLESMVRKGRIPRRRYKVRKRTLEIRLNTLSRNLEELKEKMRAAGGKYADLMRQLEIAEIEINEAEAGIKSIEGRHSRGEISLEAYRKLLTDYLHRKEKAETTTNGILVRLREEIH